MAEGFKRLDSNLKPSEVRAAFKRSQDIDAVLDEERELKQREVQILILGPGWSGKTTFLRQLQILYGSGFSEKEREEFKPVILENIKRAIKRILKGITDVGLLLEGMDFGELIYAGTEGCNNNFTFEDSVPLLTNFWKNPAVQACFEKRNLFNIDDSAKYFFENIERIANPCYLPTHDDILQVRRQTHGIQEIKIMVNSLCYRVIDVGGQRNQRNKWIHFFEGIAAVIFFVSLSSYDEFVEEDRDVNAMLDSLELFEEISGNHFLKDTEFILFLNKQDLFIQKLKVSNLSTCFPDYEGGPDPETALNYIKEVFMAKKAAEKKMYVHVTCATDTDIMKPILKDMFEILVDINLKKLSTI